jgi:hypothetical protein
VSTWSISNEGFLPDLQMAAFSVYSHDREKTERQRERERERERETRTRALPSSLHVNLIACQMFHLQIPFQ